MSHLKSLLDNYQKNNKHKFKHCLANLPKLERETINGMRYYNIPGVGSKKYISVTSVTSHFGKDKFVNWRLKLGNKKYKELSEKLSIDDFNEWLSNKTASDIEKWKREAGDAEANKITAAATSRGSKLHEMIEAYLKNEDIPDKGNLPKLLFENAKQTLNRIDNIHAIESNLYSEYWQLAGTVDTIAEFDGVLSIIDYKTSEQPKPREWIDNYFVQATAYLCMYYELTGQKAKQLVIIMTCENSEVQVYIETDIKKYILLLKEYLDKFIKDMEVVL